jgi:hypothetical protein
MKANSAGLRTRRASATACMSKRWLLPKLKNRNVADITPNHVDNLLTKIATGRERSSKQPPIQKRRKKLALPKPTPIRANRAGEMLHKIFNLAMLWKMRSDNPPRCFLFSAMGSEM